MAPRRVGFIGAGGHLRVVLSSIDRTRVEVVKFDQNDSVGPEVLEYRFFNNTELDGFHVSIGNNRVREEIYNRHASSLRPEIIISGSSIVDKMQVHIGLGSYVGNGAIINSYSHLGVGVIVNTGAIVEHDCKVDSFSHIAPGTVLCGGVRVGRRVLIGANSTVLPGVVIGDDCLIGAGSVLTKSLASGTVFIQRHGDVR